MAIQHRSTRKGGDPDETVDHHHGVRRRPSAALRRRLTTQPRQYPHTPDTPLLALPRSTTRYQPSRTSHVRPFLQPARPASAPHERADGAARPTPPPATAQTGQAARPVAPGPITRQRTTLAGDAYFHRTRRPTPRPQPGDGAGAGHRGGCPGRITVGGPGDKNGADGAAVEAMRSVLSTVSMRRRRRHRRGREGRGPDAVQRRAQVGDGTLPATDIAVDPIDGTTLTALGRGNALAVIAVAERGRCSTPAPASTWRRSPWAPRRRGSSTSPCRPPSTSSSSPPPSTRACATSRR
jgi:hypothetical protein